MVFLLFLLGGIYLIVILSRDLWQILSAKNRITDAEEQVEELEEERVKLEEQLKLVETDEFVEREARDKLLLAKEGEVVVLLPEEIAVQEGPAFVESSGEARKELANWEKWARLFWY